MPAPARRLLLVTALLSVAACGGDPSAEDERRRLADDLVAEVGDRLGPQEAECVAGRLQEAYGEDSFQAVLDAADHPRRDGSADVRSTVIDAFAECGALDAVATTDG